MKTRTILTGIGIALALVALVGGGWLLGNRLGATGCLQPGSGMMGSYGSPWGMHGFGGGVLMFLFWGGIIAGIVLLVVVLARQGTPSADRDESALEILKRRYVRGEIDRDEYERIKEQLSG